MKKVNAEGMTFTMGSPEDENQWRNTTETQHLVCLTNDYYLAIYETTRKQFALMAILAVFVAISVWWLIVQRSAVSRSCA